MTRLIERLGPCATDLVRNDHAQVLAAFRRYHARLSPRLKRGLARSVGIALQVHMRLEEEILYPAMREISQSDFLRHAPEEHEGLRQRIAQLQETAPDSPGHDAAFFSLMREVLHHMADEEALFLPEAERVLRGRLGELGWRMTQRRWALMAPRAPRLAYERARGMRGRSALGLLALVAGAAFLGRRLERGRWPALAP